MTRPTDEELAALPSKEREWLEQMDDGPERDVIACSLVAHRRGDALDVGDPTPELTLARLDGPGSVRLTELAGAGPLVLVFGSFT